MTETIDPEKPILGVPFAAPLSGKDTVQGGLVKRRSDIAFIHMGAMLEALAEQNPKLKILRQKGQLLPPEEAVKAFRRGFLEIINGAKVTGSLPHIFANGACREELETKMNVTMVHRVQRGKYQYIGFRFLLDREHIKSRAAERVKQAIAEGRKPRQDDLDNTPVYRYDIFHKHLGPVLKVFEERGGIVIDIDANETPEQVLSQVTSIYDKVVLPSQVSC